VAKLKIGVLISGTGSNLQALIDAASADDYPAEIVTVISNVDAAGLERARSAGIPTTLIDHRDFEDRETFEDALNGVLSGAAVELVCLAGFMRLLGDGFVGRWHNRLINIHPSLLPAFKGLGVHQRVIAEGVRFSGCTVHFLRTNMDEGPIIAQAAVPVHDGDDASALAARVLAEEHRIYPLAVRLIAEDRVKVVEERVLVRGAAAPEGVLINPAPA
jgi:phosphoribosylglycinamide formyltransferase-1